MRVRSLLAAGTVLCRIPINHEIDRRRSEFSFGWDSPRRYPGGPFRSYGLLGRYAECATRADVMAGIQQVDCSGLPLAVRCVDNVAGLPARASHIPPRATVALRVRCGCYTFRVSLLNCFIRETCSHMRGCCTGRRTLYVELLQRCVQIRGVEQRGSLLSLSTTSLALF